MASLFQVPTPIVGLMGRRPGQNPEQTMLAQLLAQGGGPSIEQVMAMQQQAPQQMDRAAQDQAALGGDRPRDRVSGWRILDRVLGGQTVTEGLDEERVRLQQIANQPNAMARNRQILESIQDPRERALFLADPEEWAKNVGQQFAPQVVASGAVQSIAGTGQRVGTPQRFEFGDTIQSFDPVSGEVRQLAERGPTIAEQTTQDRLAWDRQIGQGQLDVSQQNADTGRMNAETTRDNAGFSLAPGAVRYTPQGQQIAAVENRDRPIPDAIRRDNERDEMQIADREAAVARLDNAIALIDNGMINLDPLSRASAWLRNSTGNSSDQSRAQAELRRTVETLRNNILNDATGPQTDGDSLRALNQIINGWGDESVVRQGLATYREIQANKTAAQRRIQQQRMAQYQGGGQPGAPAAGGAPVRVNSPQQAMALPSGTRFITPDGQVRVRQ